VLSAMAHVLLQDKYQTTSHYRNQLLQDYLHSLVTMYIYLATAANYVEVLDTARDLRGWETVVYIPFLITCSLIGMFFVLALLIDVFCSNFNKLSDGDVTASRQSGLAALTLTNLLWLRHAYGSIDNDPGTCVMPPGGFAVLSLQGAHHGYGSFRRGLPKGQAWLQDLVERVASLSSRLAGAAEHVKWDDMALSFENEGWSASEMQALLDLAATVHDVPSYKTVHRVLTSHYNNPLLPATPWECLVEPAANRTKRIARSSARSVPEVAVQCSRDFMLYTPPSGKEGSLQQKLQQAAHWYGLPGTRGGHVEHRFELMRLTQLATLHHWRLAAIAQYVRGRNWKGAGDAVDEHAGSDVPGAAGVALDRMVCLSSLSARLVDNMWLRLDTMSTLIELESDDVAAAMAAGEEEIYCECLQRKATGHTEMSQLLKDLNRRAEQLHADMHLERRRWQGGWCIWLCGEVGEQLLSLVAWLNLFVLTLYATTIPCGTLEWLLLPFPFVQGGQVALVMINAGQGCNLKGVTAYFSPPVGDTVEMARHRFTGLILVLSFTGAAMWLFNKVQSKDTDGLEAGLMGVSAMLIMPRSRNFAYMMGILSLSFQALLPFGAVFLLCILCFSKLATSLFAGQQHTDSSIDYFATFGQSTRIACSIALGKDWNIIMFDITHRINFASSIVFVVYTFFVALLFQQMILAVIINMYEEVASFKSTRVHGALQAVSAGLTATQRKGLLQDFLTINLLLWDIHTAIDNLVNQSDIEFRKSLEADAIGSTSPGATAFQVNACEPASNCSQGLTSGVPQMSIST